MSILRRKKLILTAIIPLCLIIALSIQSYAATEISTNVAFAGFGGATYTVNANGFTVDTPAYTVTLEDKNPDPASPKVWANTENVTSNLVAGNWQLSLKVTIGTSFIVDHEYTATCQIDEGNGYSTLNTIKFKTAPAPVGEAANLNTGYMNFTFDTGVISLQDVTAIVITIS